MRIGIEASAAVEPTPSGVGNYAAHLIEGLRRLGPEQGACEILLYSNRGTTHGLGDATAPIYDRDRLPLRTLWMQLGLPRSIARTAPDLCHFPNHLAPIIRRMEIPFVATMHDMSVYRCPEYHSAKTVAVHRAIIPTVARRARLIVAVSESARQDILHYLRLPEERVQVVHEGIGRRFRAPAPSATQMEAVRARYGLAAPYLLTVGTVEPRKNHKGLVRAFARLVRQERLPHHLLIVGPHGWKEAAILDTVARSGVADRIHFLGYVPAADLPALYHGAAAFAFPSWYEGFGLPVLEAFACGVPSLISHDPALCEVAGAGNAEVVDPGSVEDIAAGLYRLLTDGPLRARLRTRGRARAAAFSWERCAVETLRLYRQALAGAIPAASRVTRLPWPAPKRG